LTFEGFADSEACYDALEKAADASSVDRRISPDEYALFVREYGPKGFLTGVETFADLPLVLQSNFQLLACLCRNEDDDNTCCVGANAGLETAGAFANENPTDAQSSYLFIICSQTGISIDRVLDSHPPSSSPSLSPMENVPTKEPTTPSPPVDVTVKYLIAVVGDPNQAPPFQADYKELLVGAMDALAPEVLQEIRRQRRLGRRLRSVQSTDIDDFEEVGKYLPRESRLPARTSLISPHTFHVFVECPSGTAAGRCEEVTASIVLRFQPDEQDTDQVTEDFEDDLVDAIADGKLQDELDLIDPDAPIFILDSVSRGIVGNVPDSVDDGEGISSGGVVGVVIGSIAIFGLFVALLVTRRKPEKESHDDLKPAPQELDLAEDDNDTAMAQATLGATTPDYGKQEDKLVDADEMSNPGSHASSSNAGSSGWSSSAGVSSLNTGSVGDALEVHEPAPMGPAGIGTTLAAMSAQSKAQLDSSTPEPDISRADLDSAIEAGDWAAVGATAALLAAASDSQSYSSASQTRSASQSGAMSQSHGGSTVSSLDAARAAELDHLVDAGDWEGVVLAAAKFEATGGSKSSVASGSNSQSDSRNSRTLESGSLGSSSPSKAQKRQELRAVVEDLVRRVVPEEIQNVDEMMLQFRGREEELVETLRTMQERAVAQKARQGAQKSAKIQAKMSVAQARGVDAQETDEGSKGGSSKGSKTGSKGSKGSVKRLKPDSGGFPNVASKSLGSGHMASQPRASAKTLGTGQVEGAAIATSLGTGTIQATKPSERERKQSALEQAIEAGDWEAVGEAAAMLSDRSVATASSADTDEINRLADGISSHGSSIDGSRGNMSDRVQELDDLIDRGDWTGVVQAASASTYHKANEPTRSKSKIAKEKKEEDEEVRRQRRLKHLQAEEDALAQAEIWMAIAEQSKNDNQDRGASEAADWAISRSLNALVQAEQSGTLQDSLSAGTSQPKDDDDDEELEV
jgi:hypothetical protein